MLTPDEQLILARYTGWGDSDVLNRAFPNGARSWARPCDDLEELLTPDEIKSLLASSLNAHFTTLPIIRAIYDANVAESQFRTRRCRDRFAHRPHPQKVRQHLATHAELLAAARLPNSAFRANAGTEVVTDVLILCKRSQLSRDECDWIEVDNVALRDDEGEESEIGINKIYIDHPERMLGNPSIGRGMYRRKSSC
jgi:hypothetical protein